MTLQYTGLLLSLLLSTVGASALSLDVKGGFNLSTLRGTTIDSTVDVGFEKTPTPALTGGVALNYLPKEHLSVQLELLLAQKGTEFTKKVGAMQEQMDAEYLYLTVPLLCKGMMDIGAVKAGVFVGVAPSLLLLSDYERSLDDPENPASEYDITTPTTDSTERFDLGFVSGFELEVPRTKGAIVLDIRHTLGLLPVEFNGAVEGRHWSFSTMVGYRFSLGR